MNYFVPEHRNYYHFITESAMGLYRLLLNSNQLVTKDCKLWYSGPYAAIVQLFSRHPIQQVERNSKLPPGISNLLHIPPKRLEQWNELIPLRDFFVQGFPRPKTPTGITVIKRVNMRLYSDHGELINLLRGIGSPVNEVIMERLHFYEQIELMRNTGILIGPHGSGETNMMFMPRGSLILELYPKGFSDRVFKGMARAFHHELIEIEATSPSTIGREPSARVRDYLDSHEWPTRQVFFDWRPERMELGRVLRDVASFTINPAHVMNILMKQLSRREPYT